MILRDDFYLILAQKIKKITPRSKIYNVLKTELSIKGYWKNKPRGNPSKGYAHSRQVIGRLGSG